MTSAIIRLLTIHGVGSHQPGDISRTLRWLLEGHLPKASSPTALVVGDLNWDKEVIQPVRESVLQLSVLDELGSRLARASSYDGQDSVQSRKSLLFSTLVRIKTWAFVVNEALIVTALSIPLLLLPVLLGASFVVGVPGSERDEVFAKSVWSYGKSIGTEFGRWLILLLLVVCVAQCVCALLLSASERSIEPAAVWFRQMFVLFVRPLILICFTPAIVSFENAAKFIFSRPVLWLEPIVAAVFIVIYKFISAIVNRNAHQVVVIVKLVLCVVLIPVLAFLLHRVYVGFSTGPIKVILDIFRYISDAKYRLKLQELVHTKVQNLRAMSTDGSLELIIVAHSLGSVIAIDSLVNGEVWCKKDCVTLITLGSPLRRYFFRFFPRLYFPPTANDSSRMIASRILAFRWINCYRPWDQIGASLGLRIPKWTAEVSTKQWTKIITAHPDYWSDSCVRAKIQDKLTSVSFSTPDQGASQGFACDKEILDLKARRVIAKAFGIALLFAIVCVFSSTFLISITRKVDHHFERLALNQEIMAHGVDGQATVTHWIPDYPPTIISPSEDKFTFTYTDEKSRIHTDDETTEEIYPFNEVRYFVDTDRLRDFLDSKIPHSSKLHDGRAIVPIKFLQSNPDLFLITQFPSIEGNRRLIVDIAICFLCDTLMGAALYACLYFWPLQWLNILLGESYLFDDGRR
jgi:hypothetical protein